MHSRRYRAFGQILSCNVPLDELEQSPAPDPSEPADLHIMFVSSDKHLSTPASWYLTVSLADGTPWLHCGRIDPGYVVEFPNLATFVFFPSNNLLQCIPHRQIPSHTLRHLLLDQVLPLILHHQGKEVLHGAAIVTPYGACAFVGPTGSGKSTLAASFLSEGFPVVTDDCVVLDRCSNDIMVVPAYPGLRLWDDALAVFFAEPENESYAPVSHYNLKRRVAAVASMAFSTWTTPLAGIYVLGEAGTEPTTFVSTVERPFLRKRDALMTLLSLAFKLDIEDHDRLTRELDFLHSLVTHVPVRRLVIPDSFNALPDIRAAILQDLARSC
jgi:hypothetical protein